MRILTTLALTLLTIAACAQDITAPTASGEAPAQQEEVVVTTDSGLQYVVLVQGDGPQPTIDDTVRVHYHGTLTDGQVFDSSVDRGEPIEFGLQRLIPAWQEAIPMMNVGSKWRLICPPELAYGSRALPGIPPNSTLIFEVELLGIVE